MSKVRDMLHPAVLPMSSILEALSEASVDSEKLAHAWTPRAQAMRGTSLAMSAARGRPACGISWLNRVGCARKLAYDAGDLASSKPSSPPSQTLKA
ncbi:hypothetical protein HGRIS_011490 [Hohenbuehelia grisea]|uniref:Uncharacterized protein n=1 Tax=Hohenbuehelia grisea TaxID=104357 RepID=A0ABR3JV79_9AGAR